ncbi:Fur family zinc uptake transcriptional regulator [Paenibacillus mucilaginosus]|uniref:Fur family transcriptional regulator n=1 Tax=Paenibacillus mucilaginosus TaxID=61624 RepID=UPI003D261285
MDNHRGFRLPRDGYDGVMGLEEHRLNRLLHRLELGGLRITAQRKQLIRLFAEAKGFLQPKDVYERMARIFPGVSFDTIYRNIRIMRDVGIVEQFDFDEGIKFRICCPVHHHHHLICLGCNEVIPLDFCPMAMVSVPESFQVVKHKFEVYGYCGQCR